MERRCPAKGRRANDSKLEHVVELLLCNAQSLRSQASSTTKHRRASGFDVVHHTVFDRAVSGAGLGDCGKVSQEV